MLLRIPLGQLQPLLEGIVETGYPHRQEKQGEENRNQGAKHFPFPA